MTMKCPVVTRAILRPSPAEFLRSLKMRGSASNRGTACSCPSREETIRRPISEGRRHCWPVKSRGVRPRCTAATGHCSSADRMTSQVADAGTLRQISSGREDSESFRSDSELPGRRPRLPEMWRGFRSVFDESPRSRCPCHCHSGCRFSDVCRSSVESVPLPPRLVGRQWTTRLVRFLPNGAEPHRRHRSSGERVLVRDRRYRMGVRQNRGSIRQVDAHRRDVHSQAVRLKAHRVRPRIRRGYLSPAGAPAPSVCHLISHA